MGVGCRAQLTHSSGTQAEIWNFWDSLPGCCKKGRHCGHKGWKGTRDQQGTSTGREGLEGLDAHLSLSLGSFILNTTPEAILCFIYLTTFIQCHTYHLDTSYSFAIKFS